MSSEFTIKKATRQGVNPLIGIYSESGCGKTYSSLLLARGLVGPTGKIVMIDTESGRGSLYADVVAGGYDVITMTEPFSPMRYVQAMRAAIASGAQCLIIDSGSHEWEGIGGVLDMAHDVEEKTGKPGLHCWKTPKMEHAKFMLAMLQSPIPTIVNLRAHYKSRQVKNDKGRQEIIKDECTTPIQSEAFIYETTLHGEVMSDHSFRLTKCSHPALRECFTVGKPISIATGEAVARWCASGGAVAPSTQGASADARKAVVARLWAVTKPIHGGDKAVLQQWLWDEAFLTLEPCETLESLTAERLSEVADSVEKKLGGSK